VFEQIPPPFDLVGPLLSGALVTVGVAAVSCILALAVAFVAGLARISRAFPVRAAATAFVEFFRGTSLIVQMFWIFYVLPLFGFSTGPIETGVLLLGLHFGAYGSEIVRGTVLSVDRGQWDAATALNMSSGLTMRRIILPQAFVAMLPPFTNTAIELLKGTAIMSLIAVPELAAAGRTLVLNSGRTAEVFSLVLVFYFLIAYPLSRLVRAFEDRQAGKIRGVRNG